MKKNNNKKNNSQLIIKLTILFIFAGLCGFLAFHAKENIKVFNNKNKAKEEIADDGERTVTVYENNDEVITSLMNKLLGNNHLPIETYTKDKKITPSKIKIKDILVIIESQTSKDSISLNEANKIIKKIYGKAYEISLENINKSKSCLIYNYNSKKKVFTKNEDCNYPTEMDSSSYKIISAVDTNDILEIEMKVIFNKDNNHYKDYKRTELLEDKDLESLYEESAKYLLTFKKEKDNYIFTSAKEIIRKFS